VKVITQHIIKVFLAVLLLFSAGCSTKKKSWVNRQFTIQQLSIMDILMEMKALKGE